MNSTGRSVSDVPARGAQLVTARTVAIFRYACPHCTAELTQQDDALYCTREGRRFQQEAGIWRLLRRERAEELRASLEGSDSRGGVAPGSEYYLALPFRDTSGRERNLWRSRAAAFRALERILDQEFRDRPVRALDLGAGNCWLARRLTAKGYAVCALDLHTGSVDGLGAGQIYRAALGSKFERVQAEMDCLPFVSRQFELVVASASLHYSASLDLSLDEACRVLAPDGLFVVMNTPFYRSAGDSFAPAAGGAAADAWPETERALPEGAVGCFTYGELPQRLARHGLQAEVRRSSAGLRSWAARLRGLPEPPSFPLVVCRSSARAALS